MVAGNGLRLTESTYGRGCTLPPHAHGNPHFCLVLVGGYRETLEGRVRRRGPLSLSFQPAGLAHAERHEAFGRHLLIELTADWVERVEARSSSRLTAPLDLTLTETVAVATRIHQEFRGADELSPLVLEGLTLELLARSARTRPATSRSANRPHWMRIVDDLLGANFADPPSLSELALAAGVHSVHLARTFRRVHGCAVGEHVRELRIRRACELLADPAEPLARIAADVGFCDQSHFARSFRRVTGTTPGRYRQGLR